MPRYLNKPVITAISVQTVWIVIVVIFFITLGVFHSKFYSFGPGPDLKIPFINIVIDTWWKWTGIEAYMMVDAAVRVYCSNVVDPWVMTVALGPQGSLDMTQSMTLFFVNLYWTMPMVKALFAMALGFTQVDFLLSEIVTIFITGLVSSTYIVYNKPYMPFNYGYKFLPRKQYTQQQQ